MAPTRAKSERGSPAKARARDPASPAPRQLVGRPGTIGVSGHHGRDTLIRTQESREPLVVDRLAEVHEATAAPCPDRCGCQLRPTLHSNVFIRGPHRGADDTRVKPSRAWQAL